MIKAGFTHKKIRRNSLRLVAFLFFVVISIFLLIVSKKLVWVESYVNIFLILCAIVIVVFCVTAGFFRYIYLLTFCELRQSLVNSFEKSNRYLFFPDHTSKILAAIDFHFKQLLEENEHLFTEIHEKEKIYNSILNTQAELVFIIDDDGYISYRNKSFDNVFGSPSLDFDEESSIFSENLSVLMQQISHLISNENSTYKKGNLISIIEIDNETKHISWAVNRVHELEPFKTLFVGRDETEEIKIRKKNEQLQRIATVGRAASTIFHEINQPLSIMQLSTFFIKDILDNQANLLADTEKDELLKNIKIIESQINRSNQIVNNLRLFHSGERKKPIFESINVCELIKDAISNIEADLTAGKIDLVVRLFPVKNEVISGNKTLFIQLLVNILKNSIQALNSFDINDIKRIIVASEIMDNILVITIDDNGPGIPQNDLLKVVEPFYTTKEEGAGLGLALCIDILNSCHGSLLLEHIQPHGLRTVISLPVQAITH